MPFRHQCTMSPFCDEDVWFVFDVNLGTKLPRNRIKACEQHAALLLRAAFSRQQRRGDEFVTILVEPTKGLFKSYDNSLS